MSIEPTAAPAAAAAQALVEQIARRRTFAIISHPDAGKTTLTEKLLLYGNAIHLAGSVRARRQQRHATSDWMAIERERGISITSTVLQFPYREHVFNLLDTPGHEDFSEDTYRTLAAVDSAVMVLDGAKGIEAQTRKLFEVCRKRGIPIFTFINKFDRPARDPLELLDELEQILGMQPAPMNWPIGDGLGFRGVYDRLAHGVYLYDRTVRNETIAPETFMAGDDPALSDHLDEAALTRLRNEVDLLDGLNIHFDHELVLGAQQTPVFFGSALTNFGVRLFLDGFLAYGPAPLPYPTDAGPIAPEQPSFAGFVFKIQANMNPNHRDSVAFLRICSGRFERDMTVYHAQGERTLRLPRPYRFFANEREVIEEAYPGDIIGLPAGGQFAIGDTLAQERGFKFAPIPRFQPEHFATLRNTDIGKQKQFLKGLSQLETEGAMQVLYEVDAGQRHPILAVVGRLQFDVVQARLEQEYGVNAVVEPLTYKVARWIEGPPEALERLPWGHGLLRTRDLAGCLVALFRSPFDLNYCLEKFPEVQYLQSVA
ncbi:MAG: peptide chain release factor 3 [Anaerolineales bacterium]|nr:peptide chain release factor 3 [Anaerolineales bacterium]